MFFYYYCEAVVIFPAYSRFMVPIISADVVKESKVTQKSAYTFQMFQRTVEKKAKKIQIKKRKKRMVTSKNSNNVDKNLLSNLKMVI